MAGEPFLLPLAGLDGYKAPMATVRFFKKFSPGNPVIINEGKHAVEFDSHDGVLGYFSTDDEGVQNQFLQFMREQRYGMSEISVEEYNRDYYEKKTQSTNSQQKWREEISGSFRLNRTNDANERLGSERAQAVLGVNGNSDVRRPGPPIRLENPSSAPSQAAPQEVGAGQKKQEFIPTLGKRKARS